jgi:type I restriction enzyme S subunit
MNNIDIRLKYLAHIEMGQSPPSANYTEKNDGFPFLQGCAEFGYKYPKPKVYCNVPPKLSKEGDILFSVRAPVGDLNLSNQVFGIGRGLCAINVKPNVSRNFIWWSLHSAREQLRLVETGSTYAAVSAEDVGNIRIFNSSFTTQEKIANYLDKESSFIDRLITEKENLLTLLSEKRQVLISQGVTNGLNPEIKFNSLDNIWLRKIPEHWEIKKVKHLTKKIGSGITPRGGAEVYIKEGIPLLRSQNIHNDGLRLEEVAFISEEIHNSMSNSKVEVGDVLLNITGGSIGRCYYFDGQFHEANVNQHVCIVRPNEKVLTKYLYLFLISNLGQNQISAYQVGGGREGLNSEELKSFIIPLPPLKEQKTIVDTLQEETDKIDKIKNATLRSIELIKERRTALITAAVTGQIKII